MVSRPCGGRSVRAGRQGGERIFQEQTEFTAYFTPVSDVLEARGGMIFCRAGGLLGYSSLAHRSLKNGEAGLI